MLSASQFTQLLPKIAGHPRFTLGKSQAVEIAAEPGIFIFQRVIAVGTGSNNLLNIMAFEIFDVLLRHYLELEFIAGSSCRVAAAGLGIAQYTEINTGRFENICHRQSGFDISVHQRPGAACPKDSIGALTFRQHFHARFVRPVTAQPH